jgi:hypothetical protein
MRTAQKSEPLRTDGKLHSIHGLLRGRLFAGQFNVQDKPYSFTFTPAAASLTERRLVLTGKLVVESSATGSHTVDGVEARLLATQGGVGGSLLRRQLLGRAAPTNQAAQATTRDQKPAQEQGPETELQPGLHAFESPKYDASGRPVVESTGQLGFAGVLYFLLSPLDGRALGIPLDLSRVQLNGRLAPTDALARDLQVAFSDIVAALYGDSKDEPAANEKLKDLNHLLKA